MPRITINEEDYSWEGLLDDLLEKESGLTYWEIDFLESLERLRDSWISDKQLAVLERLHERLCG